MTTTGESGRIGAVAAVGARPPASYNRLFLAAVLLLFILAPYVLVGGALVNGGLAAIAMLALAAPEAFAHGLRQRRLHLYGAFYLAAAFFSAFVAGMYGSENLVVIKLFASVVVYLVFGYAVGFYLRRGGATFEEAFITILQVTLGIIVLNSCIVIAEFYSPAFKALVESRLADTAGINYKSHPFRLRGVASAGGAALALFQGLGVWIALKLYKARRIPVLLLIVSVIVIPFAVLFIGRTAIVVMALGVGFFALDNLSVKRLPLVATVAAVIVIAVIAFMRNIDYFIPQDVQEYSLLFFLNGVEGLEQEGTIGIIRKFMVLPQNPVHLLFGIGYFAGGNILGVASDSGYIKVLLAFGLPLAMAVYGAFLTYTLPLLRHPATRAFVIPMVVILFIVEIKEPFVFQGYSARFMFALGGLGVVYRGYSVEKPTLHPAAG